MYPNVCVVCSDCILFVQTPNREYIVQILDSDQTTSGRSFDLAHPGQLGSKPTVDYKVPDTLK